MHTDLYRSGPARPVRTLEFVLDDGRALIYRRTLGVVTKLFAFDSAVQAQNFADRGALDYTGVPL